MRHRLCPGSPWEPNTITSRLISNAAFASRWKWALDRARSPVGLVGIAGRSIGEIARNRCASGYRPDSADRMAWVRKLRGPKMERSTRLRDYVGDRLSMAWSPEESPGRMELDTVSAQSIYRYVYSPVGRHARLKRVLRLQRCADSFARDRRYIESVYAAGKYLTSNGLASMSVTSSTTMSDMPPMSNAAVESPQAPAATTVLGRLSSRDSATKTSAAE